MADMSKAQKLASARKKFKELKKEKKKSAVPKTEDTSDSIPTSREQTPVENVINPPETSEPAQLPNYFQNSFPQPMAFFDSFVQNNGNVAPSESPLTNMFSSTYGHENVNNFHQVLSNTYQSNEDVQEVPKIEPELPDIHSEAVADFHAFDAINLQSNSQQPQLSGVESLLQISNHMAELINPTSESPSAVIESQLETRNQELAALLSQEKLKSEQLSATLNEYLIKIAQLEAELRDKELNTDNKVDQEISSLQEQLQCHMQTVGILVAEKTELVANLSQFQSVANQKSSECEELQGRLKTSRSRVAELEREIALLKNEKSQYDNQGKEQNTELEKLKTSHQQLKDERDELMQDLLEVREKLKSSSESNLIFQQQIGELSNQLSLANIKIQQLTTGEIDHASGQVEQLTQEKFALEKQVSELNYTIKTITKEREESSIQYQQYAQQLNAQIANMATRLDKLQKENESLQIQEQNRIKHIGELEKQLQNIQNDQVAFAVQKNNGETRVELDAALELVEKLKLENTELQEGSIKITNEKEMLMKDLEAKGESVRQLEELVENLRGNQPDTAKLLATMESDKVAASRAVSQNTELKKQMDSMQEVFMKMNNDKIELIEKLSIEQRNNKDLFEKLQKTEIHLQTLADAIEIKDKELSHLRESSLQLDKQVLQSEQLNDRLRHYEARDNSNHSLQNELQEAKQLVEKLTTEISQFKENPRSSEMKDEIDNINGTAEDDNTELVELRRKLEEVELKNKALEAKLTTGEESPRDSNHNDQWTVLDKDAAMKHLEDKFMKTMEDIANLTEEKQRLEHLVLQLQGETETIGEYVALYQQQRSLLKQKAIEKDQQLSQLASDREQMKNKLEKLNELVKKLVLEKGTVPPELLEHHDDLKTDNRLCEEHAKMHNEINKIAQHSFTVEPNNCDSQSTETAEQIIALLSEIKSSNLVQPAENFHHCPWCSGQLITV